MKTAPPVTVFLVRHAEKAGTHGDVPLSPTGELRARALAHTLADVPLDRIHSTPTVRTRSTAAPTATAHAVEVQLYDPRKPQALIDRILAAGGHHLVVGHSNTVPDLVERLGGDGGRPIDEPSEYDRLYVVTRSERGDVRSILLRYGP